MSLLSLPLEILHCIISECTGRDIIAFGTTCRSLRRVCTDATVFQRSFCLHLPDVTSPAFATNHDLLLFLKRHVDGLEGENASSNSAHIWARLAVVAERLSTAKVDIRRRAAAMLDYARNPTKELSQEDDESFFSLLGALSMAAVWGCPSLCDTEIAQVLDGVSPVFFAFTGFSSNRTRPSWLIGSDRAARFAFCLALGCLAPSAWIFSAHDTILTDDDVPSLFVGYEHTRDAIGPMLLGPFNSSGTWDGWQSQDLLHIVNIIQALRMWSVTDDNAQLKLPNPSKISFVLPGAAARASGIANGHTDSVLGFPIPSPDLRAGLWSGKERCFFPCTSQSWKEWYKAQTRSAVREMLEGEWFGYYTYWLYSARDDPMQSIRFQLVREHEDAYEIEALECFDGIGQFTLRGQVNLTDGTIQLHKDYASHGFAWRGRVTPLGICGCYSTITDFDIDTDGAFWLWKREWMDEDEEQNC